MSVEITLQRSPHDREHPYAMISNALLDDKKLSINSKLILIYISSNRKQSSLDICTKMKMSKTQFEKYLKEIRSSVWKEEVNGL